MPPKRAKAAGRESAPTNGATSAKAAGKKAASRAVSKPTSDTTAALKPTKATASKAPAKPATKSTSSRKRALEEEDENEVGDEKPKMNGVKRSKSKSATPAPQVGKRKAAGAAQGRVAKKVRTKQVINHAPTECLDVYVFGDGTQGTLGLGSGKGQLEVKRPRLNPLLDAKTVGVVHVSVGGMHAAALTHDNKILTWGVNDEHALGRDTTWEAPTRDIDDEQSDSGDESADSDITVNPKEASPGEVDTSALPDEIVWTQLACTDSATFALTDEGQVYGWGTFRANEGVFGFRKGDEDIQATPLLIPELKKITTLAGGANHVLALASNGTVYAWGAGQQNQLGRRLIERHREKALIPTSVGLPKKMVNVGAGAFHSFAMHANGDVYSWGLNSYGETGIAKEIGEGGQSDVHQATVVESLRPFGALKHIEGGSHHTVAVTEKGECLVWGRLDAAQLGIDIKTLPNESVLTDAQGHPRILTVPTLLPKIRAVYVAAGSDHSLAVTQDGTAYAWGFSSTYQTGLGTDDDVEIATKIENTATRNKQLVWAGCGGQFSVLAGIAGKESNMVNGVNGHA